MSPDFVVRWCLTLLFAACFSQLAVADKLKLDLSSFREAKQYGGGHRSSAASDVMASSNQEEAVVGVGLIDALQRWADALEAQIGLMRSEMTELRASGRRLREEAATARQEGVDARREATALRKELNALRGEMGNDMGRYGTTVATLSSDVKTLSTSFTTFLTHYDKTLIELRANDSLTLEQVQWAKGQVKDLSATLGASDHNVEHKMETVKSSIEKLHDRVAVLTQADYILEERIKGNDNRTETYARTLGREIASIRKTTVTSSLFKEAVTSISQEIDSIRSDVDKNVSTLTFSVKAIEQAHRLTAHNLTKSIGDLDLRVDKLGRDLQAQARAFGEDFLNFQKSIDFAKTKYDELTGVTSGLQTGLRRQERVIANVTTEISRELTLLSTRQEATDGRLTEDVKAVTESLNTFVGQVGAEIIKLHTADEELKLRAGDLESSLFGGDAPEDVDQRTPSNAAGTRIGVSEGGGQGLSQRVSALEQGFATFRSNFYW